MDAKTTVMTFFRSLDSGAIDDAFRLVADDARWWVAGSLPFSGDKSKQEYLGVVARIKAGFPGGLGFRVKGLVAEDEAVAAEVESDGTHVNGRRYQNRYHFLLQVRGGQIVGVKEYMDTQHLVDLLRN